MKPNVNLSENYMPSKNDMQELITNALANADKYKTTFGNYKEEVKNGNIKTTILLLSTAAEILKNKTVYEPIPHLMAIRVIMELMELNIEKVFNLIKKHCFPVILELALFKKEIKEDARGKS